MPRFSRYYEPSTWDFMTLSYVRDCATKEGLLTSQDTTWARDVFRSGSDLDLLRLKTASRAILLGNLSIFIIGLFFFMQVLEIAGNFALGVAAMATPLFLAPGIAYIALICRGNFSLHTIISPENVIFRRVIAALAIITSAVQVVFVIIQITVFCDPTNALYLASSAYQQLCNDQRVIAISAAVLSSIYLAGLVAAAVCDFLLSRSEMQYTRCIRMYIREHLSKNTGKDTRVKRIDAVLFTLASVAAKANADLLEAANYDSKRYLFFYIPYIDDIAEERAQMGFSKGAAEDSYAFPLEVPRGSSTRARTGSLYS